MAILMTADNNVGSSKDRKILQGGKEKSKNVQTFKNSFIIHELNNLSRALKSATCPCFKPGKTPLNFKNFILISILYIKNTNKENSNKDNILFHCT